MRVFDGWPQDGAYHRYCIACHSEAVRHTLLSGRSFYRCHACGAVSPRAIVVDPAITWWVDVRGEYWHESAGVFVRGPDSKFLFFRRTGFPFVLTVPSGHVDLAEPPAAAAAREAREEVGLETSHLIPLGVHNLVGDSCWRGSDAHRWHAYLCPSHHWPGPVAVEEGEDARWLALEEACELDLAFPARYIIEQHAAALTGAH